MFFGLGPHCHPARMGTSLPLLTHFLPRTARKRTKKSFLANQVILGRMGLRVTQNYRYDSSSP